MGEKERKGVREVRTSPIDVIRRIGKRLVCIPQQGSCICKVAYFFFPRLKGGMINFNSSPISYTSRLYFTSFFKGEKEGKMGGEKKEETIKKEALPNLAKMTLAFFWGHTHI